LWRLPFEPCFVHGKNVTFDQDHGFSITFEFTHVARPAVGLQQFAVLLSNCSELPSGLFSERSLKYSKEMGSLLRDFRNEGSQ